MNKERLREYFKSNPTIKSLVDFLIMNQLETRPRWYVRLLAPLYQKRGRGSKIYSSVRMDTPPYRRFSLGKKSVIESFGCINNAVGDVIIGDNVRVGLRATIIGPVSIGNHVIIAQNVTISALNHNFSETDKYIDAQGISTKNITIGDDVWIGANAVILSGVKIGSHSVIAAGAVVTRDVPEGTLVAGTPAVVKKAIK
ncbi:MAG: acyltransferase [Prevotella sp.]